MYAFSENFSTVFALLTIFTQAVIVFAIVYFFILKKDWKFVSKNAVLLAFIYAFAGTIGSLIYSDVIGFDPCKLCWIQRIFMYPQFIILGTALLIKDKKAWAYPLVLSSIGILVSTYHYYLQLGGSGFTKCAIVGQSASCSERMVWEFGYVSIPMMALTAFAALIVLALIAKKHENR